MKFKVDPVFHKIITAIIMATAITIIVIIINNYNAKFNHSKFYK